MQLSVARVCLDCEELHDSQQCPVCASETFAYLTQWVLRLEPKAAKPPPRPILTPTWTQRIVFGGGAMSLLVRTIPVEAPGEAARGCCGVSEDRRTTRRGVTWPTFWQGHHPDQGELLAGRPDNISWKPLKYVS